LNTLVIDTASNTELIAISKGEKYYSISEESGKSHSITIFSNIKRLLEKAEITISDINLVGVGQGPGSFTGIRIAVTTARMLAQILDAPIVGIKTHEIYAASAKGQPDDFVLIAFDAKKKRVFGALYQLTEDSLNPKEIVPPGDYTIGYLVERMDIGKKSILTGDGIKKYIETINKNLKNYEYIPDFKLSGEISCRLVNKLYEENPAEYKDLTRIIPFYARKSDAEIAKGK